MVCDLSNLPFLPSLQWHFTFSHFVVEPGQEYEVTVHHLPKPIPDGDPNHQSMNYLVPGKSALPSPSLPHMAL